jgi:hypothetical protein
MKKTILFFSLFLVAALLVGGCAIKQLSDVKKSWANKDFEWIAAQQISCDASDDGCNQLHLIKGDACYRLAKDGKESKAHYACAMDELETGIVQTKEWKTDGLDLNRAQTYENLCESIRNLQDLETGAQAEDLTKKLVNASQAFLAAEPSNLGAIYFLNSARYAMLGKCVIHPERCPSLCENLAAIEEELAQVMPKAEVSKYMNNYHRLQSDVKGAKRPAGCQ